MNDMTDISKTHIELTRENIESCLDDELNEMYNPWEPYEGISLDAAVLFKTLLRPQYNQFFEEYCKSYNIIILNTEYGERFFEPIEN